MTPRLERILATAINLRDIPHREGTTAFTFSISFTRRTRSIPIRRDTVIIGIFGRCLKSKLPKLHLMVKSTVDALEVGTGFGIETPLPPLKVT
jgi:hypothetical protein